jgi:hypothetical protein
VYGTVSNERAHPHLSFKNTLIATAGMRFVQGHKRAYYCSSWTTPGNGQDLSMLSGFCVAAKLGAAYPFPANRYAADDFQRLKGLMGL